MTTDARGRAANGRSSIHQDRAGRWHGWVSFGVDAGGRGVRRHVTARSRGEVTAKVRDLERVRDSGGVPYAGRRPTLSVFLTEWIKRRAALDVRPSTVGGYLTDQKYVDRTIGYLRMDRVRPADIENLWSTLVRDGLLPSVAHVKRTLSAAFGDALHEGLVTSNPVRLARTPRYEAPEIDPFTIDEVRKFLDAATARRNAARWILAVVLGLRQGEALGLQWADFDVGAGTIAVRRQLRRSTWRHGCVDPSQCGRRGADCPMRQGGGLLSSEPKSRAGRRTLALPGPVVTALNEHRKTQVAERLAAEVWEEGGWIFTTEWGTPLDQRRDWGEFKVILKEAGLRDCRLHDLRHAAATLMLESEVDLRTAGRLLGHSSISQTERYSHVLADRKRAAATRIESLVWGTGPTS